MGIDTAPKDRHRSANATLNWGICGDAMREKEGEKNSTKRGHRRPVSALRLRAIKLSADSAVGGVINGSIIPG